MKTIVLLLGVFVLTISTQGAKVLVYNPYFAHSHFSHLAKLADILQEDGHNVVS